VRRVVGVSMAPTLLPGTVVLGVRPHRLKRGDLVIIQHEGLDKVKRVKDVSHDYVFVVGDNLEASTDSRHFGWLPLRAVAARVVWHNSKI